MPRQCVVDNDDMAKNRLSRDDDNAAADDAPVSSSSTAGQSRTRKKIKVDTSPSDDDRALDSEAKPDYVSIQISNLGLSHVSDLDIIGRRHQVPGDGNCGYHAILKGLEEAGVIKHGAYGDDIIGFRKLLFDFAESQLVGLCGLPLDKAGAADTMPPCGRVAPLLLLVVSSLPQLKMHCRGGRPVKNMNTSINEKLRSTPMARQLLNMWYFIQLKSNILWISVLRQHLHW